MLEEITNRRLGEVKRLLASTELSILQVGRQAGFNDPDNLKRLFRKRFGVPMRDWRKASRLAPPKAHN